MEKVEWLRKTIDRRTAHGYLEGPGGECTLSIEYGRVKEYIGKEGEPD
jgi:hypothetical protein